MPTKPATIEAARAAKQHAKLRLARVEGVGAVGLTRKGAGYAVKVNLAFESAAAIPTEFDGVPVVVEVVGGVAKQSRKPRATSASATAARPRRKPP